MEMDLDALVQALEVRTNQMNEAKRVREIKEHNAKVMQEALGKADV